MDGVVEIVCRSCFGRFAVDPVRLEEHLGRTYQRCPRCYASAVVEDPRR